MPLQRAPAATAAAGSPARRAARAASSPKSLRSKRRRESGVLRSPVADVQVRLAGSNGGGTVAAVEHPHAPALLAPASFSPLLHSSCPAVSPELWPLCPVQGALAVLSKGSVDEQAVAVEKLTQLEENLQEGEESPLKRADV